MDLDIYRDKAYKLVYRNRTRNEIFSEYEKMYHCEQELPRAVSELDWIRPAISSEPHNQIVQGIRMLASLEPRVRMQPLYDNPETRRYANEVERNLLWQLRCANRRRSATVQSDVVYSALLYDMVAFSVIDLDWQIKIASKVSSNVKKLKQARRHGRFAVVTYNPRCVYTQRSDFGVEVLLTVRKLTAVEIISDWGVQAKELERIAEEDLARKDGIHRGIYCYDMWDLDNHTVWCEVINKCPLGH